jgi:hypothetical protein
MKQSSSWTIALALIIGIVVGFLDLKIGYTPSLYAIILIGAIVFSAFNIKQAKLIALILGGSILIAHGITGILGIAPPYEIEGLVDILKPIVLAIGGAFIGVRTSIEWAKLQNKNYLEEEK